MIEIELTPDGVVLPIRARPGARADEVRGEHNGRLKVSVTQAAEKGKANKSIIKLLAAALDVRRSQMKILSGETSADKRILIQGVTEIDLRQRLSKLI